MALKTKGMHGLRALAPSSYSLPRPAVPSYRFEPRDGPPALGSPVFLPSLSRGFSYDQQVFDSFGRHARVYGIGRNRLGRRGGLETASPSQGCLLRAGVL